MSSHAFATMARPIVGVLAAIGITTAMDASGLSVFSALPLGIEATHIYGPEVGVVGLILNALFAFALWRWLQSHRSRTKGEASA